VLKYISPPVVYQDAIVELVFDPKSIMSKIMDVKTDDLPFVQAKIGLANINFEGYVNYTQVFKDGPTTKSKVKLEIRRSVTIFQ